MAYKTKKEKVQEALEDLKAGTEEFFQSENYGEYLDFMAQFHQYSARNCILIKHQMPDASLVCGYNDWQKKFNRHVKQGEKGIRILAPYKGSREIEDKNNLDKDGNPMKKTVDYIYFQPVYVFDVSQTDGEPIPELIHRLDYEVADFERIRDALTEISDAKVFFDDLPGASEDTNGYYRMVDHTVHVRQGMSNAHTIKTLVHEIVHSRLHKNALDKARDEKEIEAESTAYVVCRFLGLDTSDYSFGYVATWAKGKKFEELTECLTNIKAASEQMIKELDQRLCIEMSKEEAANLTVAEEAQKKIQGVGVTSSGVIVIDEAARRRDVIVYVTNGDGTYQTEAVLHGDPKRIEEVLRDRTSWENFEDHMEQNQIGCTLRPLTEGVKYDFWYNYEARDLRPYPDAPTRNVTVLAVVNGPDAEKAAFALADQLPVCGDARVSITTLNRDPKAAVTYTDWLYSYPETGHDTRWPMITVKYTNVDPKMIPKRAFIRGTQILPDMDIHTFQKLIAALPEDILKDPGQYFKVSITYVFNDEICETIQDIDLGRGKVDYLNYMKLPGTHIAHLKSHSALLSMTEKARLMSHDTARNPEYVEDMEAWADYCRGILNHESDRPKSIPVAPPIDRTYLREEAKEWRMELC